MTEAIPLKAVFVLHSFLRSKLNTRAQISTNKTSVDQRTVNPEFLKVENVLTIFLFCASETARTFETAAIPLPVSTLWKGEQLSEYAHGMLLPHTTRAEHQLLHLVCLPSIYLLCLCLNRLSEYFGSDYLFRQLLLLC